jgi:hypothetical protein
MAKEGRGLGLAVFFMRKMKLTRLEVCVSFKFVHSSIIPAGFHSVKRASVLGVEIRLP